jgi:hypothetical protein
MLVKLNLSKCLKNATFKNEYLGIGQLWILCNKLIKRHKIKFVTWIINYNKITPKNKKPTPKLKPYSNKSTKPKLILELFIKYLQVKVLLLKIWLKQGASGGTTNGCVMRENNSGSNSKTNQNQWLPKFNPMSCGFCFIIVFSHHFGISRQS